MRWGWVMAPFCMVPWEKFQKGNGAPGWLAVQCCAAVCGVFSCY